MGMDVSSSGSSQPAGGIVEDSTSDPATKQKFVDALKAANIDPDSAEAKFMLASGFIESNLKDFTGGGKGGGAANLTPFNLNVDEIKEAMSKYNAAPDTLTLCQSSDPAEQMKGAVQAMDALFKADGKGDVLSNLTWNGTGGGTRSNYGDYQAAIKAGVDAINGDSTIYTDNKRLAVNVGHDGG